MDRSSDAGRRVDQKRWAELPTHRAVLWRQAQQLLDFHRRVVEETGRFVDVDDDGQPYDPGAPQQLYNVGRAVHCYALGDLLGVPGSAPIVERGLAALRHEHHDDELGGYFDAVGQNGVVSDEKSAYGHAFVLLAASSALLAGFRSEDLLDDVLAVLEEHFWCEADGASREGFSRDWHELDDYRGANSNMHLCEALLAASDALRDDPRGATLAGRAESVARLVIDRHARAQNWMLPEHYDGAWRPLLEYNRDHLDDRFRPYGVTVGHLLEWSRLLRGVGVATSSTDGWTAEASEAVFRRAVEVGWDYEREGLVYTVDFDGTTANPHRYWWPIAEGIAAAAVLGSATGDEVFEAWYRRFWDFATRYFVDHRRGGWFAQLDETNVRIEGPWRGKPDLYHALQTCLVPRIGVSASLAGPLVGSPLVASPLDP